MRSTKSQSLKTRSLKSKRTNTGSPVEHQKAQSHVRIIGGLLRGRKISFNAAEGLRPTLDRIRETVFNWLAANISESRCLDLFAGSGALGFEAISRGAGSVTLVDANTKVCSNLKLNLATLEVNNATVYNQNATEFLAINSQKYDLVFVDPPFDKGLLPQTLEELIPHLNDGALVYVEQEVADTPPEYSEVWEVLKSKKTSRFYYQLLSFNQSMNCRKA